MKLVKACIAMAAFAALFVVPSMASAIQLTSPTGTPAPVGLKIQGTNVAHAATVKNTQLKGAFGTISCEEAELTGEIKTNGPTHVVGEITTGEFKKGGGTAASCTGPLGDVIVTPNHANNPVHNGASSLPWCITAGANDEVKVWGKVGSCTGNPEKRPVVFTLHMGGFSCTYSKAEVIGTYTTHPAAAIATFASQKFTRVTSGSIFCPEAGELFLAFTLETDVANPTDVYIDP